MDNPVCKIYCSLNNVTGYVVRNIVGTNPDEESLWTFLEESILHLVEDILDRIQKHSCVEDFVSFQMSLPRSSVEVSKEGISKQEYFELIRLGQEIQLRSEEECYP